MPEIKPFDLGQIMMTAETLKAAKEQSITERLRRQYMGDEVAQRNRSLEIASAQEQRLQTQFSDEQRHANTTDLVAAAESILSAADPVQQARQIVPVLKQRGILSDAIDQYMQETDPNEIRQGAQNVIDMYKPMLRSRGKPEELVTTVGEDGQPVLTAQSQAEGKRPYTKADGNPSSYDEFVLAQKDPAFAAFLKSRRGKGLSVTMPDGTVISMGGEGSQIGPDDLTAPTRNSLQQSIVGASDELDRLNSIGKGFDPKFLQIPGRAKALGLKIKDLAGGMLGNLSPEDQRFLGEFSTFTAEANKNLSAILNRLSGAAISPAEAERLKKGIPNEEDSPTQFQAKYKAAVKDATRAIMRANWALSNGIGVRSVDQLSRVMPLEGIDQVYQERANQIWQELGGGPESRAQAIQRANAEFGVAR